VAEPHSLPVQPMEELAEIHFGDLEGLTYTEIEVRYPDLFESWINRPEQTRFPNGESFAEMRTRVLRAQDLLLARHSGEHIAVVTHAGVIRLLLCEALSIPARLMFRLAQRYASINRIEYFPHGPIVQLMNA
jgi:alpha-ribazole phosphatase/probable phosphoglycerate mutase